MSYSKKKVKRRNKKQLRKSAKPQSEVSEWSRVYNEAIKGNFDEEQRALIAKKASMMAALKEFKDKLGVTLNKCDSNLGLLLELKSSITGSLVIIGTGDNGENEYVPVRLTVQLGPVQDIHEHVDALKTEWHRAVKEEKQGRIRLELSSLVSRAETGAPMDFG